ncbi:ornithine cyclodeaminase family protein [Arthrobacter sp. UYP6]|uniref:ornithine cyclodeaminase family protein n=1 Tax=Arthrobacter sp. UYP6 TaxID=1756378 RepID=UPI0033930BBB
MRCDAKTVRRSLPWATAISSLEEALSSTVDPEDDSPRLFSPAPAGEFLIMPATGNAYSGVKVLTVAPGNPERGLEKIQGLYLVFDSVTSTPLAVLDGTELTSVRTAAVTLLAVKHAALAAPASDRLPVNPTIVVFGAGIQARNHISAAASLFPGASVFIVGRNPDRTRSLVTECQAIGITAAAGSPDHVTTADIILCTTTSPVPLFSGAAVKPGCIVAAVGSHGADAREVDADLVLRSDVVVEGRASAMRENGNLLSARSEAEWGLIRPLNLQEVVLGTLVRQPGRPCLYTGVGMAWEDLVLAGVVYEEEGALRHDLIQN